MDLEALVGGRVSVPKEQVYPRFDALARCYRDSWREAQALENRGKLHGVLQELRQRYFPALSPNGKAVLGKTPRREGQQLLLDETREDPVDLDTIPGPDQVQDAHAAVRLTVENYDGFLNLPLDFQGFCIHTLVARKGLLVPGNPALGVVRYAGRYCVFATERAMAEFCSEPERFFGSVREACYKQPEFIHLLRVHEDFPRSSLQAILVMMSGQQSVMLADDSNIDKSYEWNEWKLRQEALHVADIRRKTTSTTQTALSHLRRENETQVYLPKEMATNTTASRGTNPPRLKKYYTGLRGEPRQMQAQMLSGLSLGKMWPSADTTFKLQAEGRDASTAADLGCCDDSPVVTVDVRLEAVERLPKENIYCSFQKDSFDLQILHALEGRRDKPNCETRNPTPKVATAMAFRLSASGPLKDGQPEARSGSLFGSAMGAFKDKASAAASAASAAAGAAVKSAKHGTKHVDRAPCSSVVLWSFAAVILIYRLSEGMLRGPRDGNDPPVGDRSFLKNLLQEDRPAPPAFRSTLEC
eukprot:s2146_g11.t1